MIDINLIRTNPELVKENIRKKFQDKKLETVDKILELDKTSRLKKNECDTMRARRNTLSSKIGKAMKEKRIDDAEKLKMEVVEINNKLATSEQ